MREWPSVCAWEKRSPRSGRFVCGARTFLSATVCAPAWEVHILVQCRQDLTLLIPEGWPRSRTLQRWVRESRDAQVPIETARLQSQGKSIVQASGIGHPCLAVARHLARTESETPWTGRSETCPTPGSSVAQISCSCSCFWLLLSPRTESETPWTGRSETCPTPCPIVGQDPAARRKDGSSWQRRERHWRWRQSS